MEGTKIDFKTSSWQTAQILPTTPAKIQKEILRYCGSDGATLSGLYEMYDEYLFPSEVQYETEETVTVDKNDGFSTIEIKDEEDEIVWRNGK